MALTTIPQPPEPLNAALLRQLAAARAATQPELAKRLERAVCLLLAGKVHPTSGGAMVESTTEPGASYIVDGACECADYQHQAPHGWCAHRLAVDLLRALPDAAPLAVCPEAAFSITLKGHLGGHEVLLTARGQTWEAFEGNVQRLRGLLDAPAATGSQARSPQGAPPPCPAHGPVKESSKAPGTYYCTKKLYDGSYCKYRWPDA